MLHFSGLFSVACAPLIQNTMPDFRLHRQCQLASPGMTCTYCGVPCTHCPISWTTQIFSVCRLQQATNSSFVPCGMYLEYPCILRDPFPSSSCRDRSRGASQGGRGSWTHSAISCTVVAFPKVTWNRAQGAPGKEPSHSTIMDAVSGGATTDAESVGIRIPKHI